MNESMALGITKNEISTLLDEVNFKLENLNKFRNLSDSDRKNVSDRLEFIRFARVFENNLTTELVDRKAPGPEIKKTLGSLIKNVYYQQVHTPVSQKAEKVLSEIGPMIQTDIQTLSTVLRMNDDLISRARQVKLNVNQAYERLKRVNEDDLARYHDDLFCELLEIKRTPDDLVMRHYEQNRDQYRDAVLNEIPEATCRRVTLEIEKRIEIYKTNQKKILHTLEGANPFVANIRENARKMVEAETVRLLREIPVEQINNNKNRIRTKALKENGYTTMARVYLAKDVALSNVQGISWDNVRFIRMFVNEMATQIRSRISIRLSVDNKSTEATDLVRAIFGYRKRPEATEALGKYKDTNITETYEICEKLKTLDPCAWFFFDTAQKESTYRFYDKIGYFIGDTRVKEIEDLIGKMTNLHFYNTEEAWADFAAHPVEYINILEKLVPEYMHDEDEKYGLPEEFAQEIMDQDLFPDGLLCELRRYQEIGVKYILHQGRVLLGDEMGLGKTIQAIAAMVSLRNIKENHFLVICPASVMSNWMHEISRYSRLKPILLYGKDKQLQLNRWMRDGGVAVTNFESTSQFELKNGFRYSMLVVDEAHYIKNEGAQRTLNVKRLMLATDRVLFMTGTALENKVEEMIALIGMLQPAVAEQVKHMTHLLSAPMFRQKVIPVYYRRKREDVLRELPDLIENLEWCAMTPIEEAAYENVVMSHNFAGSRRVSWNINDLNESSKAQRLLELVEAAKEDERKVIVFSFFLDTIDKVCKLLKTQCMEPIKGNTPVAKRDQILEQFDKAGPGTVLPLQIVSGSTGLNIQTASVIILCEPQLKPSIENQAISRAYRMGQTRKVLVYRLLCENSVDERILERLEQKQELFDEFADKSEAAKRDAKAVNELAEGNSIIEEEIERIKRKRQGA